MRSRIMTSDVSHRKDFKSRLLDRIVASSQPPVPELVEQVILLLPHNYQDMSEAELQNKLAFTVELQHSPATVLQALDIVFGRTDKPTNVKFQLVYLAKPTQSPMVTLTADTPVDPQRTEQDAKKRQQFKADLAEKINAPQPPGEADEEPGLTVRVPVNHRSMASEALYSKLVSLNVLTPDQAQELFATLGGRKINTKFNFLWDHGKTETVQGPPPKTVQVIIPGQFKSRKVTEQYGYLVRQLALTPEEANDVIDILKGKSQRSRVIFDIIEEEG